MSHISNVLEVWCYQCGNWLPPANFQKGFSKAGFSFRCINCEALSPSRNATSCLGCGETLDRQGKLCSRCIHRAKNAGTRYARVRYEPMSYKTCRSCGLEKPIEEFGYSNKSRDGHNGMCRTCTVDTTTAILSKQKFALPGDSRAKGIIRAQRSRVGDYNISYSVIGELWSIQAGRCFYCKKEMNPFTDCTLEHRIPVKNGGTNTRENLVLACLRCNSSKNDQLESSTTFRRYLEDIKQILDQTGEG